MSRRQHLRQVARQSLGAHALCHESTDRYPLRPLASMCRALPPWAEPAATRLLVSLDRIPASLSEDQKWGAAIAASIAAGNSELILAVLRDAEGRVPHQMRDLARATAVAALLSHRPTFGAGLNTTGGNSPQEAATNGATGPLASRSGSPDATVVELFALAAIAAQANTIEPRHRVEEARRAGVPDEAIASVFGIAHAISVVATILNGRTPQDATPGRERLRVSKAV